MGQHTSLPSQSARVVAVLRTRREPRLRPAAVPAVAAQASRPQWVPRCHRRCVARRRSPLEREGRARAGPRLVHGPDRRGARHGARRLLVLDRRSSAAHLPPTSAVDARRSRSVVSAGSHHGVAGRGSGHALRRAALLCLSRRHHRRRLPRDRLPRCPCTHLGVAYAALRLPRRHLLPALPAARRVRLSALPSLGLRPDRALGRPPSRRLRFH